MADIARLTEVIEPEAQALGFDLVRVKIIGAEAGTLIAEVTLAMEFGASSEDIARTCIFLCESDNDFINGQNIVVDGGMTKKMIYL